MLIVLDKKIESMVVLYSLFLLGCKVFVTNLRTCDRVISEKHHINVVIGNEMNRQINSTVETWSIRLIMEECLRGETPAKCRIFNGSKVLFRHILAS